MLLFVSWRNVLNSLSPPGCRAGCIQATGKPVPGRGLKRPSFPPCSCFAPQTAVPALPLGQGWHKDSAMAEHTYMVILIPKFRGDLAGDPARKCTAQQSWFAQGCPISCRCRWQRTHFPLLLNSSQCRMLH